MPFDFPNSPTIGQSVTASNGATYVWDGVKWITAVSGGGNSIVATGGSIARTLPDRFADRYSVLDWLTAGQPDGTTNNTAQLQTAITAAAGKASLTFPAAAHPYVIGTAPGLQLPSNTHLIIEAGATLLIAAGTTGVNCFGIVPGAANVLVDLYGALDGNGSATTPPASPSGGIVTLSSGSCSNVYVRGDRQGLIRNFVDWPINITNCTNGEVAGITIDGGGYSNSAEFAGLTPANAASVTAGTYNTTTGAVVFTTSAAHGMNPGDAFVLLNTAGTGNYAALAGSYTASAGTAGTTINATTYQGFGTATLTGATIRGPTKPCVNVGFSNCIIRNIADLGCVLYGGVLRGFIRDCDIYNCTGGGAMVFSDLAQCGANVGCEIVDNVLHDNGGYGAYVGHNLNVGNIRQRHITVGHNNIFGNNGCGVYVIDVDGMLIDNNLLHDNIYQPNMIASLGITGEISTHTNSGRVTISNNVIHNPNVGCADGKGYGIAFNTSNYLVIEGNRIGDYQPTMSMQAALAGNWGQFGLSQGNYYGPRIATTGAFPPDQSVYQFASQQGPSYDSVLQTWCGTSAVPGGPYLPISGGTMTGPLNYTATGGSTSRAAQDRAADWINILDLGAAGNGVTLDSAAWTAAFALPSGSVIHVPQNCTTLIDATAYTATSRAISIIGDGPSSVIKFASGTALTANPFTWASTSGVRIEKLTIDMNNIPAPSAGVAYLLYFNAVNSLTIRDVRVINMPLNIYSIELTNVNYWTVENCYFQATAGSSTTQSKAIYAANSPALSTYGRFSGNILVNTNTNFGNVAYTTIINNDVSGWGVGAGLGLGGNGYASHDNVIIGNRCHDSLTALDMYGLTPNGIECWGDRSVIANNMCWNCCGYGIFSAGGASPSPIGHSIISGNQCWDNITYVGGPTVTSGGIVLGPNASGTAIIGNQCWDSGVGRQTYGFNINNSGNVDLTLDGNRFSGSLGDTNRLFQATFRNTVDYVPRILSADPTVALGAVTKQYVDALISSRPIGPDPDEIAINARLGTAAWADLDMLRSSYSSTRNAAYQVVSTDWSQLLLTTSGTNTWTLPAASDVPTGWWCRYKNRSGASLTLAPTGTDTINGTAGTATLATGSAGTIIKIASGAFEVA